MSNSVLVKFGSIIKEENVDVNVLWDKIHSIVKERDKRDFGLDTEDFDELSFDDFSITNDNVTPTIESVLNELMILNLTIGPEESDNLENKLKSLGLGFLVDFLNSLTESEVMDYITDDVSFDFTPEEAIGDVELEILDVLDTIDSNKITVYFDNSRKDYVPMEVYSKLGRVYLILDGFELEFKNQDEDLQNSILDEIKAGNYNIEIN